jgi:hypothetical protein
MSQSVEVETEHTWTTAIITSAFPCINTQQAQGLLMDGLHS